MNQTDKIIYALGLAILGGLAVTGLLQVTGLFTLTDIGVPCTFRTVTGFYCPGCGGTHAVCALAVGHLWESVLYHPFVPYTAVCFLVFIVWNTIATAISRRNQRLFSKKGDGKVIFFHFHIAYVYVGLAILFLQWIIKNAALL